MAEISKWKKALMQLALVVLVLAISVVSYKVLASLRKPPAKKESVALAPLVNAVTIHPENIQMTVTGFGTVNPKQQISIVPQVSGQVVACDENFVNGGFFKADQILISIDPRDYQLAVEAAQADVAGAQTLLDQELAEAQVAEKEWDILHPNEKPSSPLVLREPQIRQGRAQVNAAKARLKTAELNLQRTNISVPFDGRIAEESVDLGQYLAPGQTIATVYATDSIEIVVPLEDRYLQWFDLPMGYTKSNPNSTNSPGTMAIVTAEFAGKKHQWSGQIVRAQGKINPNTRMIDIVVEVKDPFKAENNRPPLTPGMFVEINIIGKMVDNIFSIPSHALHNGDQVWIVKDNKLKIQKVHVLRIDKKYAYINSVLEDGDVIVTSPLDVITDNMKIRTNIQPSNTDRKDDKK